MKRYQLIGRKKELQPKKRDIKYPTVHLHSLPYEILLEIFQYIKEDDIKTFLLLSLTCHKFNTIANKNFLYREVKLCGLRTFTKFTAVHLPTIKPITKRFSSSLPLKSVLDPSSKINLMIQLETTNPPAKQSGNTTMKIAGSYNVEISRRDQHDEYIEYTTTLLNIFRESYSLKHVIISEISPQFEFPNPHSIPEEKPYTLSLFSKAKSPPTRILTSLTLKAQSGWSIPFKFNHLSAILNVYGAIDELILHNFIIDELKLSNTQSKLSIPMVINKLTLNSCTFILDKNSRTGKRNPSVIFQAVSELKLLNISSGKDLSVIDFIKLNKILRKITIDFGSPVFYDSSSTFNFARYNLFFKLLCSGQGAYSNIKELSFINFSLLDNYGHTHHMETKEEESDDWVAPATDTFETLLSYVSTIPKLTITLVDRPEGPMKCVNCGTTKDKPRKKNRYSDWVLLLRPLLRANKNCMVEVLNHRDKLLFRREIEE